MSIANQNLAKAPIGAVVGTYSDYDVAQKAVSKLISAEIAARDIVVVGVGVRSVERVTGKLGYGTAARSGAINGVLLGLLIAAFSTFGAENVPIQLILGLILCGVALGMIMSLVTYLIVRRRRDFASVTSIMADTYEVRVLDSSIHRAREIMGAAARPAAPAAPRPQSTEPPRYGERISQTPASTEPPRYGERIAPAAPVVPENPVAPEAVAPEASAVPEVPAVPDMTDLPAVPEQPELPADDHKA